MQYKHVNLTTDIHIYIGYIQQLYILLLLLKPYLSSNRQSDTTDLIFTKNYTSEFDLYTGLITAIKDIVIPEITETGFCDMQFKISNIYPDDKQYRIYRKLFAEYKTTLLKYSKYNRLTFVDFMKTFKKFSMILDEYSVVRQHTVWYITDVCYGIVDRIENYY